MKALTRSFKHESEEAGKVSNWQAEPNVLEENSVQVNINEVTKITILISK
jgi:hypothetical protein